ncbi:hypothetical protein KCP70_19880 [Salmonella enterica subsp. enterica]|nr:hypothetical protein KCP70_19880 [Salmonella enterica subsp. enterica]
MLFTDSIYTGAGSVGIKGNVWNTIKTIRRMSFCPSCFRVISRYALPVLILFWKDAFFI